MGGVRHKVGCAPRGFLSFFHGMEPADQVSTAVDPISPFDVPGGGAYFLPLFSFASDALHHARENRNTREITNASTHDSFQLMASESCKIFRTMTPAPAYTEAVARVSSTPAMKMANVNPFMATSSVTSFVFLFSSLFDGGGRGLPPRRSRSSLRICPLHYLVDSLSGEVKLICYLAQTRAGGPQFVDFHISWNICRRPWAQRPPLPAENPLELDDSLLGKLIFAFSLPHISHPSSQCNFCSFDNFNMNRRNPAMAISFGKLTKGRNIFYKPGCIVHGQDNNSGPLFFSATISFVKIPTILDRAN